MLYDRSPALPERYRSTARLAILAPDGNRGIPHPSLQPSIAYPTRSHQWFSFVFKRLSNHARHLEQAIDASSGTCHSTVRGVNLHDLSLPACGEIGRCAFSLHAGRPGRSLLIAVNHHRHGKSALLSRTLRAIRHRNSWTVTSFLGIQSPSEPSSNRLHARPFAETRGPGTAVSILATDG